MDLLNHLANGFAISLQPLNLMIVFIGVFAGLFIGVYAGAWIGEWCCDCAAFNLYRASILGDYFACSDLLWRDVWRRSKLYSAWYSWRVNRRGNYV